MQEIVPFEDEGPYRWHRERIEQLQLVWAEHKQIAPVAQQLGLPLSVVRTAVAYYCEHAWPLIRRNPRWTAEEIEQFITGWQQGQRVSALCLQLHRSRRSLEHKRRELHLPPRKQRWTATEDQLCRTNLPLYRIMALTGRTQYAVYTRRRQQKSPS